MHSGQTCRASQAACSCTVGGIAAGPPGVSTGCGIWGLGIFLPHAAQFNRLGDVDTMRRYIYIHGSPDSRTMGQPGSIGCIRMHNRDVMELFDLVDAGTPVEISEAPARD